MNMISGIGIRRCDALVDTLTAEFGGILAQRILEAEAFEFLWDARVAERYLGEQTELFSEDDEAPQDVSRIAVLSFLAGAWQVGICLVDGGGNAIDLVWRRLFESREEAEAAFARAL